MIKLRGVTKYYGKREIIAPIDLTVDNGEAICFAGPSGCGKSTLLRIIAGLEAPDCGSVQTDGGRIAMLFQDDRLLPWYSALENILAVGAKKERALHFLERLGLLNECDKLPSELSGGMRRRVAIARTLAFGGDIFLLDEPIRGLDDGTACQVIALLKQELCGKTAIIISHNEQEISELAKKIYRFSKAPLRIVSET